MSFLADRNDQLDPRYRDIARLYKHYGEAWDVRWDYAFFQMALETNYLKYRRGNGRRGDVRESQNNFAGIGATGGGVAGERFTDVKTGVHAQIQHLVAYSGERVADPVAKRTRENQDSIIEKSLRLRRPVTFGDLARRWAADRAYARSIDTVAGLFRDSYCNMQAANDRPPAPVPVVQRNVADYPPPSRLGGPQDQMRLAGPDDMPLSADAAAPKPQAQAAPDERGAPKKPKPPVRTIWTREDGDVAPPEAVSPPATATAPEQEPPAEQKTVSKSEPQTPPSQDDVVLPRFKITPSVVEPSKLGGPIEQPPAPPAQARAVAGNCRVQTASYGGKKTLLLRDVAGGETHYTALTVLDGFEKSMVDTFAKAHAIRVDIVGEYASREEALADANANCGS